MARSGRAGIFAARSSPPRRPAHVTLPAFRPRSAPEIVDAAVQLARRHYASLGLLSVIVAVPSLAIGLVMAPLTPTAPVTAENPLGFDSSSLLVFPLSVLAFAWMTVGFGALVASAAAAYVDGRPLEPFDALRRALGKAWALVAGHFVAAILVALVLLGAIFGVTAALGAIAAATGGLAGGAGSAAAATTGALAAAIGFAVFALTFAGALLLWSRYVNLAAAVMLEDRGPLAARRRSTELVKGSLARTAGVVLVAGVVYLVGVLTAWAIAGLVTREASASSQIAGALGVALYPFVAALLTVLYYDLRIRREGYDLELMSRALGQDGGAAAGEGGVPA